MTFTAVTRRYLAFGETRFALIVFLVAVAFTGAQTPLDAWTALAAAAGALFWLLIEYPIHRGFLHMPRPESPAFRRLHARLHSGHHRDPDKPELLFIPWWVTAPSALLVGGVAVAAAGDRGWQFFCGFWGTLLVYEWLHLAIHLRYSGRNRVYRFIRKGHMLHHYKNERYWFGITNPLADYVMRTHPQAGEVATSETVRTLGFEPHAGD